MGKAESLKRRGLGNNAMPPPTPAGLKGPVGRTRSHPERAATWRRGAQTCGDPRGRAGLPPSPPPGPGPAPGPRSCPPRRGLAGAASVSPAVSAGGDAGGKGSARARPGRPGRRPAGRSRRPPGRDPLIRFSQYIVRFTSAK